MYFRFRSSEHKSNLGSLTLDASSGVVGIETGRTNAASVFAFSVGVSTCLTCRIVHTMSWNMEGPKNIYVEFNLMNHFSVLVRKTWTEKCMAIAFSYFFIAHFFYRQIDFSSEPGVANEILENEPKNCFIMVAWF